MKWTMQKVFMQKFIFFVVIPSLLLIAVGMPLLIYQVQKEEEKNLDIVLNNYKVSLEQEISNGSMKLSQFLLINDKEMLDMMANYSMSMPSIDYNLRKQMNQRFNYLIAPNSGVEGMKFYFENGTEYSYKIHTKLSKEQLKKTDWYQQITINGDRVYATIVNGNDFIPNVGRENNKILLFLISPQKYDRKNKIDFILMAHECHTFKAILQLKDSDYIAGIVDDKSNILLESDSRYVEQIDSLYPRESRWNTILQDAEIGNTGWKMILAKDKKVINRKYLKNIMIITISTMIIFYIFYIFAKGFFNTLAVPISGLVREMQSVNLKGHSAQVNSDAPWEIQQIQIQFNRMIISIQELINTNQKNEYARHQEELKALQSQINPHFLSNTLNTIKFMAEVSKNEGIREMTESLVQILDCSFRNFESIHTVEDEVRMLNAYFCIIKIRYAENFNINLNIEDRCKKYTIPKLILQPFIENALFHGLQDDMEEGSIEVNIFKKEIWLEIVIEDNGEGIDQKMLEKIRAGYETKSDRIGIANVIKRLDLYYKDYYHFTISSSIGKGTRVELSIPIDKEEICTQL